MRLRRTPLIAIATAVLSVGALTATLLTTGTAATAEPVTSAQPAAVSWSHVGPGWVLAQYTTAAPEGGKTGPVTLYLISPGGARYQLARWPDFRSAPELVAWAPDGKRALFQVFSGKGGTEQETLVLTKTHTLTAKEMAAATARTLVLDKRAYKLAKDVYGQTAFATVRPAG